MQALDDDDFTSAGIAALLPGMEFMMRLMQRELDSMRSTLRISQGVDQSPRLVTPRKRAAPADAHAVHPRDPRHPDHETWLRKLSKSQKAAWRKRHEASE